MGVYLYSRLPSAYQEVEYIESSGTQRIDTGLKPTDATFGFKGKVNMTAASGEWNIISINGTSTTDYLYRYSVQGSGTQWQTSNIMTSPSGWANVGTVSTGVDYEFLYNYNSDRKFTVNGTDLKTGLTAGSYSSYGVNWNIFCAAAGTGSGSYSRYGSFKLYYMQIYQGTTLVRDFIPCYRKADGVIGLYDLVNNQFYTNSGTGTFSKGADVDGSFEHSLKNAYIGDGYYDYTPTSYTIVYRPLRNNLNDYSGNNRNLSGTATFANNKSYNTSGLTRGSALLNNYKTAFTISEWTTGAGSGFMYDRDSGGPQRYTGANGSSGNRNGNFIMSNSWRRVGNQSTMGTESDFVLLTVTYDGSTILIYNNGVQFGSLSISSSLKGSATSFAIEGGTFGQIIMESRAWSEGEILGYYNNSKSNYGL